MNLLAQAAEATPNSSALVDHIINAAIAITGILTVIFMNRRQKNVVSFEFTPADKREFDKHVERNELEHKLIAEKVAAVKKEIDVHLSERSNSIYRKLDEQTKELREDANRQSERRDSQLDNVRKEIESKIDDVQKQFNERFDKLPEMMQRLIQFRQPGGHS